MDTPLANASSELRVDLPPTPQQAARAELDKLYADESWVKRHLAGDHVTRADQERLCAIIAEPPAGVTMHGGPTIEQQRNQQADDLAKSDLALSAAVIEQVRNGTPEPIARYEEAMRLKRSLFADPAWRRQYFDGDFEARRTLSLIQIIQAGPVTLESK